jgi:hypothetical protein
MGTEEISRFHGNLESVNTLPFGWREAAAVALAAYLHFREESEKRRHQEQPV